MTEPNCVCVFASGNAGVIAVAKSLLEVERIEYFVKNEYPYGAIAPYNFATGPVELWVVAADANESHTILKDLTESS